jgi:uncharacterized protein (DUF362 family)/Pyruvate/2-oxoacid:ferredoxin oxidoreductase delta subunit
LNAIDNNPVVSIVRLDGYEPVAVDRALHELLEPLGGISAFVSPSARAVLKPNFLWSSAVDRAICTHPEIVRGVARLARESGAAEVVVTDSPGVGTARRCAKRLGLEDCADFSIADADDGVEGDSPGFPFHRLALSRRMREADVLINLPKAKTHGQMVLTGAVKNTFGAVVGFEKAQWHYRAGRDPRDFAKLLVQIHEIVRPKLHVLDAVVGMEGNGPGSGTPRRLGCLVASTNGHAVDIALCRILGVDPAILYTLAAARELGVAPAEDAIEIVGPTPESLRPSPPWAMARPVVPRRLAGPGWLAPAIDRMLSLRPRIDRGACTLCGSCVEACAARAMALVEGRIVIDTRTCISCFCCQEMCPSHAISVRAGPVARLLGIGTR